ncbi:bidirectional sugar transporter SWEET16 [Striga asiatica]|uniref:Bidirectional sugar transporter SWEET16 n=1 Tax=Striga asiatica TaxID=4170 RepID=A0A5A7R327_STRAF|nr:bidirectional sugar transporter SWEET16 [Striga asiatica]
MDVSVVFGVLGNIVASLLFLSPADTFWRILKNRSTEDFESIPYTLLLLNASLWVYYGIMKPVVLLVTINGFGSLMMVIYLTIFVTYAPPRMKVRTVATFVAMNVGFYASVILVTKLTMNKGAQVSTAGTLCVCVTVISFASPLSAMKTVVMTKSVEFMPFFLTFFYFLVATIWSIYRILLRDTFILVNTCD